MEEKAIYAVPGDAEHRLAALNDVYAVLLQKERSYLFSVATGRPVKEVRPLWNEYIAQQRLYEAAAQWFFDHDVLLWFDRDTLEYYVAMPVSEGNA